jgi:hypothetical protein
MSTDLVKQDPKQNPFQALVKYQTGHFNVCMPVTTMDELPRGAKLSVRIVQVNGDEKAGDVYATENGKVALTGTTLDRIGAAAGITWLAVERTDGRAHPHYCEFTVVARVVDFDGSARDSRGVRAIDLREDAGAGIPGPDYAEIIASAKKKSRDPAGQLLKARQFLVPMCEAKAKNRAIRRLLSLRGGYKPEELKNPFVVPKLVIDTADPMARQMLMAQMTGAATMLYGRTQQSIEAPRIVEAEPADDLEPGEGTAKTPPPSGNAGAGSPPPAPATQQTLPLDDVPRRFSAAFKTYTQMIGCAPEDFAALCMKSCGKKSRAEMSADDVSRIEAAVQSEIMDDGGES